MKISKIKIENFRNIKSLEFDVSNATVISGENELGKSNALNALVWFLTDTIYTDNSGVGENDINSIVPKNQVKGEYTSVSVTFTDGPTFTKVYKTGYDRITGKPNKHTTEGSINSVACKNMNEWSSKLMDVLNFKACFTSAKELNMFIDPLYALQKLDAKQLRTLLVSFGCTATNEEMYKLGFEDLRQYESKYLGDFVNMRLDLKRQVKTIMESVSKYTTLVGQYNTVEEFDNSRISAVIDKVNKLQEEKTKIKNGGNDEAVRRLRLQLKEIMLKLNAERDRKIAELNLRIKEIEGQKALELETMRNAKEQECTEARNEITRLKAEIKSAELSKDAYERSLGALRASLISSQNAAKSIMSKKSDYQGKLVASQKKVYTAFVVCPCCGNQFAPDEEAERAFNEHKAQDIQFYTEQISQFNLDIDKYNNECKKLVAQGTDTKNEIAKLETVIVENTAWLSKNEDVVNQIMNTPSDMSRINEMDAEIGKIRAEIAGIPSIEGDSKILEMHNKISILENEGQSAIIEALNDKEDEINEANDELENLYIERSNWNQKVEYTEKLDAAKAQLNDVEALSARVNDFIHTMIQVINDKAKAKTGMDFVMLEENLGNDGLKEVCYAVVDGVPFAMINTAKKYEYGIKFIEKVKDIAVNDFNLPRNDLPILADKFEGIDHIEKIKSMTPEQLICTRVGLEKEITIL